MEGSTFTHNDAFYGGAIAISAPVGGTNCTNQIDENMFFENYGRADAGAILISTSYIDVNDYVVPTDANFNLTFETWWFEYENQTNWTINIYSNIFDYNLGALHGGAILISPYDFTEEIEYTTTPAPTLDLNASNSTNSTNGTYGDSSEYVLDYDAVQLYEIAIYDNNFTNNNISSSGSDNNHGGGAISWLLASNSAAMVTVTSCQFVHNFGANGQGGAIWVSCDDCTDDRFDMTHYTASWDVDREDACEFCDNAYYLTMNSTLRLEDSYFEDNHASQGGAVSIGCIGNLLMNEVCLVV